MLARVLALSAALLLICGFANADTFVQTNLTSDTSGMAANTDPNLINPWGIAFGPTTPFWVADNGSGVSTLYSGSGAALSLVVSIPPSPGSPAGTLGTPTGVVFNGAAGTGAFNGDRFIFATEDGNIAGWSGGTSAAVRVDSPFGSYTGLAITTDRIFAANQATGQIDVFDSSYQPVILGSSFVDPTLPSGYKPFNIQNIGGLLYVTYANGAGGGIVDVFDTNGALIRRFSTGGVLNDPWGLALAPSTFGNLGGDILIGNFGNGTINAFDLNGNYVDTLKDGMGNTIVNESLWGLAFGNGGTGFDANKLYFTAGLANEQHGLFASLTDVPGTTGGGGTGTVPEPTTVALFLGGLAAFSIRRLR